MRMRGRGGLVLSCRMARIKWEEEEEEEGRKAEEQKETKKKEPKSAFHVCLFCSRREYTQSSQLQPES